MTNTLSDRIDRSNPQQLAVWALKLNTTPLQLQYAIDAVGNKASDVEMRLKRARSTTGELAGGQSPMARALVMGRTP